MSPAGEAQRESSAISDQWQTLVCRVGPRKKTSKDRGLGRNRQCTFIRLFIQLFIYLLCGQVLYTIVPTYAIKPNDCVFASGKQFVNKNQPEVAITGWPYKCKIFLNSHQRNKIG